MDTLDPAAGPSDTLGLTRARIMVAIGTRPEAVKLAPVVHQLRRQAWAEVRVLATGQHRDMLDQVLAFFGIQPDVDLDLMRPGQPLAALTSRMIDAADQVLERERPDLVVGQGDTTTVMVLGLCCYYRRLPFAHVEAGLRTGDRHAPFPEEINRSLVARLAELHFAPTERARQNLLGEGIANASIHVTGNTVVDALRWAEGQALPPVVPDLGGKRLVLVTAHRRENFGTPLAEICAAVRTLVELRDVVVFWPVHRNPEVHATVHSLLGGCPGIQLLEPLEYPRFLAVLRACALVLSDSGGVQEEASALGKPVLLLREITERPESIDAGVACLVGTRRERILRQALALLDDRRAYAQMARAVDAYGDGRAAPRIVAAVEAFLGARVRR